MSRSITETKLPNGMKIFATSREEVFTLYEQIQEYCRNGIELCPGDTVFDVGANIGLFTLWVYQQCNQNVTVYAFEPIPATFDVLQSNAQRFGAQKIKVFPWGLSNESKIVQFDYYPNATALSNAFPSESKEFQNELKEIIISNLNAAPPRIRWLRWVPPFIRSIFIEREEKKSFQTEQVLCQLKTLSSIVREHNIQQIDLLKIDVEKSELDVFLGIEELDWPKIKQVVVEIHDINGRVEKITNLLKAHGLTQIILEQEPLFKDSNIFNLYALRLNS